MKRVVVISDHPALSTGFARVSDLIARSLTGLAGVRVSYLARESLDVSPPAPPYELHLIGDSPIKPVDRGRFDVAMRQVLDGMEEGARVPVICVDATREQLALLRQINELNLRERIYFICYMPIDFWPLSEKHFALARTADLVVPYSEFGRRALLARDGELGDLSDKIHAPIPHSVDTTVFRVPTWGERQRTRKTLFNAGEDETVIGFFSRNTERKRVDLVLLIFFLWSTGSFVRCGACKRVTAFDLDPVDLTVRRPAGCRSCSSSDLKAAEGVPGARLYLHTELLEPRERRSVMGWDIERLVLELGMAERVVLEPALQPGVGLPDVELARRMGACDIHLLPFMGGGWELTVLETAACGVPNVITDFAAPPEYAHTFSELIPVEGYRLRRYGVEGIMDIHAAVAAVARLAGSKSRREELADAGPRVAQQFSFVQVAESWRHLLAGLDPD